VSVVDILDTNEYAHDPRQDFLNWAILDTGSFDYVADAWGADAWGADSWGATYGAAAAWYQGRYAARVGLFDMPSQPTIAWCLDCLCCNSRSSLQKWRSGTCYGTSAASKVLVIA
jgi:hypothetical protein